MSVDWGRPEVSARRSKRAIDPSQILFGSNQCCATYPLRTGPLLLTLDTNHCRTGADHIEFPRGSTAQIYNATTAIRPAIYYAHYNRLAVTMISNQHHRTKWQCLVRCSKPVWASDLTTCGTAAAVECGAAGLGKCRTDRCRSQNNSKEKLGTNHQV